MYKLIVRCTFVLGLLFAALPQACKTPQPATQSSVTKADSVHVEVRTINRPVKVVIPVDSAAIKALVKCPDGGKPVIVVQQSTPKGKRANLTANFINDVLTAKCKCDSIEAVVMAQDSLIKYYQSHTLNSVATQTKVVEVKHTPGFVKFLAWCGGIAWLLLIAFAAYKFYKFKTYNPFN